MPCPQLQENITDAKGGIATTKSFIKSPENGRWL